MRTDQVFDPEYIDQLIDKALWANVHLGWMKLTEIPESSRIIIHEMINNKPALLGLQQVKPAIYWLHTFCAQADPAEFDLTQALKTYLPAKNNSIYAISVHIWFSKLLENNGFVKCDDILQFQVRNPFIFRENKNYTSEDILSNMIREAFECESAFPPLWQLNEYEFQSAVETSNWKKILIFNNEIIGYLLADIGEEDCYINRLAVKSSYQHSGAASTLLSQLIGDCRAQNITLFSVNTNRENGEAVNFYSHRGFTLEGKTYSVYHRYIRGSSADHQVLR